MNRATAFNRALSLGGILSLILLAIAFQTTNTREAEAQTAVTEKLVEGSPWKGGWAGGGVQKVRLRFFSGKDGKFTATFNKKPTSGLKIDGKKVKLTAKRKDGKIIEFSLTLGGKGKLSGLAEYVGWKGWKEEQIVLKPAR